MADMHEIPVFSLSFLSSFKSKRSFLSANLTGSQQGHVITCWTLVLGSNRKCWLAAAAGGEPKQSLKLFDTCKGLLLPVGSVTINVIHILRGRGGKKR